MNRIVTAACSFAFVTLAAWNTWAGSSRTPPGGDQGSSGSEPALFALLLFAVVPGIFFVRKALMAQKVADDQL